VEIRAGEEGRKEGRKEGKAALEMGEGRR